MTIGAKDGGAVSEAKRRIFLIVDPPEAEVGAVYPGKVVNITKFGAFVNILPGRDGLLHISKVGGGKRVDRVEDVLSLGQDLEVKVDDIDPQGKVSLSLAGEPPAPAGNGSSGSSGSAGGTGSGACVPVHRVVAWHRTAARRAPRWRRSRPPSRPSSSVSSATSGRGRPQAAEAIAPSAAAIAAATVVLGVPAGGEPGARFAPSPGDPSLSPVAGFPVELPAPTARAHR